MRCFTSTVVAVCALAVGTGAHADTVVLDFEGLGNLEAIQDFYNGGTGDLGSSGTNFGVSFSPNALGIIDLDAGGGGNFANEPTGETIMFFLSGGATTMNFSAGFDTGFSFFYSSNSFQTTGMNGVVTVWDGLNGTGNMLAMLQLPDNIDGVFDMGDPTGLFDTWTAIGASFAGIARSVDFGGALNQIGFDNITFGAATPGGGAAVIPLPTTAGLGALGLALLGLRRRDRVAG